MFRPFLYIYLIFAHLFVFVVGELHPEEINCVKKKTLTKVIFASCFHPRKNANIFQPMVRYNPDLFLWTGDSVYHDKANHSLEHLREQFEKQKIREEYAELRRVAQVVDGTWDDHDYGLNDGGKYVPHREARQQLFLDFLGVPPGSFRRQRAGVYSSFSWGRKDQKVRVILLDTRYHRDLHVVPSVGGFPWLPLGAVCACFSRLLSSIFKVGENYGGDVLGEEQWQWLDRVLGQSSHENAQITLIVSSIQVFSSSPVMEGWAAFPRARTRLLDLITLHMPKGLLFLSGDVHHAELIGLGGGVVHSVEKRQDGKGDMIIEVTSSGLTHSCTTPFFGFMCPYILQAFSNHRASKDAFYTGKNYGTLSIDWLAKSFNVSIHDEEGAVVLSTVVNTVGAPSPWIDLISGTKNYRRRARFSSFQATDRYSSIMLVTVTALVLGIVLPGKISRLWKKSLV